MVKLTGDGMLVEFASIVNAVACAAEIQRRMRDRNAHVPKERRIEFRVGVNLGDVIVEGEDIFGDGVNVAARLEGIARPGGIAISGSARDHIGGRLDLSFEDLGERALKNIDRPIRVYAVSASALAGPSTAVTAPRLQPDQPKPSIAVIPFTNSSGDPGQDYFSDGITEDIITDLSKVSGLFVVARNTVFTYKGKPVKMQEVAAELGVKFLLEGSVRKAGQRVRINAQLIDGEDGGHIWADRYDRDLTDIFTIQDEITHAIVGQLKIKLLPDEKRAIEAAPTEHTEAYTYYLKGRQFLNMWTKSYMLLARRMFSKAVELDPLYARAHAGIAACNSLMYAWHGAHVSHEDILATSAKALALDGDLAEAHATRGLALYLSGRHQEAGSEFELAIALDPNLYEAHFFYAGFFYTQGDFEKAARCYEHAAEIQPDDYRAPILLQSVYRSLGRRDEEEKSGRLGLKRAERALRLHPENSGPAQMGATALAALGERDQAMEWAAHALAIDPEDHSAQYNVASVYSLLGELDRAVDMLEQLLPKSSPDQKQWFKNDSDFAAIRTHPRYGKLLALVRNTNAGS